MNYLQHLALCHTIVTSKDPRDETKIILNSSSPDELSLLNAAKYYGVRFVERNELNEMIITDDDVEDSDYQGSRSERRSVNLQPGPSIRNRRNQNIYGTRFQLLNVIEFTSDRKRMTVIVRTPDGKIKVLSKGADSVLMPLLNQNQKEVKDKTFKHLQ